jgi:hypothetical protein
MLRLLVLCGLPAVSGTTVIVAGHRIPLYKEALQPALTFPI